MPVKLFVGGLSFSTSSDRLREAFTRFGSVTSAAVMNDRETGRSRGFGFVEMATPEEADKAISGMNGTALDGRTIRVDKATPRGSAPPRSAGGPGAGRAPFADRRPPVGGGGGGGFGQRYADRGPASFDPRTASPGPAPRRGGGGRAPFGDQQGGRRRGNYRGDGRQGGEGRRSGGRPLPDGESGSGRGRPSSGGEEGYRWGR